MKRLAVILILFLMTVLFSPHPRQKVSLTNFPNSEIFAQQILDFNSEDDTQEMDEEDDVWYEQEFFQRKLFQKTLPPLTNREAIKWSFIMAEPHTFL